MQVLSLAVPTKVVVLLLKISSVVILKNKKTWFLVTANFLRHPPLYPTCPLLFLFLFLNTNFSFHTILRYFIVFNFPTPDSQSTKSPTRPTFPKPNLRHIFPANNHVDLNSIFFESICFFPFCCTTRPWFSIAVERGSLL